MVRYSHGGVVTTMYMLWMSLMLLICMGHMVLMLVVKCFDFHEYDDDTDHDTDDADADTGDGINYDTDDDTDDGGRGNLYTISVPRGKVFVAKIDSWS